MSKHTPGPWEAEFTYHNDPGYEEFIKRAEIVYKEEDATYVVARMDWSNPKVANTHLMAAAPDLLEACKTELKDYEVFCKTCGEDCDECAANGPKMQLEKAIAKAEGKDVQHERT